MKKEDIEHKPSFTWIHVMQRRSRTPFEDDAVRIVSLRRDSVTWQVELFRMALTQSMTELSLDFVGSSKGGNAQDF
ncbi:hypothetical protein, partial [Thalassotalea sp. ND16A]|uniref:hypothetical protein n=1 Tax=Thalassotalea sp. ND16A TaxID=1535422 RepID=UPI00051A8855